MTTQIEPISGRVAKILNSREVALNIGKRHGVTVDMVFEILSPGGGEQIVDPDSGAVLGSVNPAKTKVKISRVDDAFSIAGTYRSRRFDVGGIVLFQPPKWETRYETLKIDGDFEPYAESLDEKDSYVATGDPVVQVIPDR